MKLVKTSAIVLAVSAMLSGAAFAQQGMSSDSPTRNSSGRAGSGMSTGADTELNSQADAPGAKAGARTSTKGTVGSGHGATSGSAGVTDDTAVGTKRH